MVVNAHISKKNVNKCKSLQQYDALFSFLYDFENFEENKRNGSLLASCNQLENALAFNGKSDIDSEELHSELIVVSTLIKNEKPKHMIDILITIQKFEMANVVPNYVIAVQIAFTYPVSVASGERSFSKLKIVKTYLRNSMNQERLNDLSIISIEKDVADTISHDDIIDEFADMKARKKQLKAK